MVSWSLERLGAGLVGMTTQAATHSVLGHDHTLDDFARNTANLVVAPDLDTHSYTMVAMDRHSFACGLRTDHSIACWGWDNVAQRGSGALRARARGCTWRACCRRLSRPGTTAHCWSTCRSTTARCCPSLIVTSRDRTKAGSVVSAYATQRRQRDHRHHYHTGGHQPVRKLRDQRRHRCNGDPGRDRDRRHASRLSVGAQRGDNHGDVPPTASRPGIRSLLHRDRHPCGADRSRPPLRWS